MYVESIWKRADSRQNPNKIIQKEPIGPDKTGLETSGRGPGGGEVGLNTQGGGGAKETQVRHLRMIEVRKRQIKINTRTDGLQQNLLDFIIDKNG